MTLCPDHRLPENHECDELPGLTKPRQWFSRAVRSYASLRAPIAKPLDPSQLESSGIVGRSTDWKREAHERDSGPDLAPDGSLIYDRSEWYHVDGESSDGDLHHLSKIALFVTIALALLLATRILLS